MNFKQLVVNSRSYRRFFQNERIPIDKLLEWIEIARFTPSGRNLQPVKFIISLNEIWNERIFKTLFWAGYLPEWDGPEKGEQPAAYIIMLIDLSLSSKPDIDIGIIAQTIMLAASNEGYGGCMIASINKAELKNLVKIPEDHEISLVLALGKPKETVVITDIQNNADIKYWRDEKKVHYVPKRLLDQLIIKILN